MYWIAVKTEENITEGDVLSFDISSQLWNKANSLSTPLGVAKGDAKLSEDGSYYRVDMQMQGQIKAKSSRLIPDEGGEMNVENGAVFVDNGANHAGIISPNFINAPQRTAGELIEIVIR
tara:strand:+ start:2097 stop:2453 length:357 start_codon:yes stop_codon:yes gene_type:complete